MGPEAAVSGGMVAPSTIGIDDDIQDFEDYTIDDQDKYQVPRKNVSRMDLGWIKKWYSMYHSLVLHSHL